MRIVPKTNEHFIPNKSKTISHFSTKIHVLQKFRHAFQSQRNFRAVGYNTQAQSNSELLRSRNILFSTLKILLPIHLIMTIIRQTGVIPLPLPDVTLKIYSNNKTIDSRIYGLYTHKKTQQLNQNEIWLEIPGSKFQ